ncbi:Uma2 family endonuclease [Spirulina sp. CCNP1310]|uniref:Uma2 family endonuclease n=1 Tax=Spirulina sp. CCNP1310 TaxID=3110249 RepID=UPI002B1F2B21|nr:Uma2 family endonuclease [Spirulina sp. CCNP1310]MEA5421434.1 Uma2 family endonuclease [Spirulina sp. CCNP1310]
MAIATAEAKTYTAEDYLALEVESEIRNEYRNGEIIPMTGGTPNHNKLTNALSALLWFALRQKPYSVFVTDQRLWIPERDIYTYPDVMAIAEPLELKAGRKDTVINPILLAEVLSPSTAEYDRADKFTAYRTIPTFQEYLLIAQDRPQVEQFIKQGEQEWLFIVHQGLDAVVRVRSLHVEIALADLYEGIEFEKNSD